MSSNDLTILDLRNILKWYETAKDKDTDEQFRTYLKIEGMLASNEDLCEPIIQDLIPATNWAGTMSTVGYFLTITINTAKEIGIIKAIIFPKNCSLVCMDRELPTINNTPDIPNKIEIKVTKLIFSFKKI